MVFYMLKMLYVGLGGFIGAVLRYLAGLALRGADGHIPLNTLAVNITGGLLIGFLLGITGTKALPEHMRLFLVTGVLGGLTTFSAFTHDTLALLSAGKWLVGMVNILLNVALSLGAALLGMSAARFI